MKRLNWGGWALTMVIIMLGAIANKNINSLSQWAVIVGFIGMPLSLFPLIVGRKPKERK